MVLHGLKHIFQKPCPDLSSSERTQQLRSKTVYSGTVNLAKTIAGGNNNRYKTYNGPYEVAHEAGNSTLVASQSYDDLLSITKGKVLLNQLPLNSSTQSYYQKNFGKGEMYVGVYNQFDPSFNFIGNTGCDNSVMVYDISANGFTGSYESGGFIGTTGPAPNSVTNQQIFIDPDHCYYSDPCLMNASYTRFVSPDLAGLTGTGEYIAQQIIGADQYRGFAYPMPNFNLTCVQQVPNQSTGPLFCPPVYQRNALITTFPKSMYKVTYLNSSGASTPGPQLNGFTIYQFGVAGTIPLDTAVTHSITYSGSGSLDLYYAVIGGGGGGGSTYYYSGTLLNPASSGGGGGGYFYSTFPSSTVQLLSNVQYTLAVGGGGSAGSLSGPDGQNGSNGKNSIINFNGGSQIGYGGGGGATAYTTSGGIVGNGTAGNGSLGNGGGGAGSDGANGIGGAGTFNGGPGSNTYAGAGGGGGMTQAGGAVPGKVSNGGNGIASSINGSAQYFGAGGGGGASTLNDDNIVGIGGQGGGGNGGWWNTNTLPNFVVPQNGANVFGSGGGGAPSVLPPIYSPSSIQGANGGSGSVWIRFNSYAITN